MEVIVPYLLMQQKCINSKQKIQKYNYIYCGQAMLQNILHSIAWKRPLPNAIDTSNILYTYGYLMKETWHKIIVGFILKTFIRLLTSIVNACNHTKCVSLSKMFILNLLLLIYILINTLKDYATIHLQLI